MTASRDPKPIRRKAVTGGALLRLQNNILEVIAKEGTLASTCEQLCREVEAMLPNVICSVLTVDAAGNLHPLAATSLPLAYSAALHRITAGPLSGSCGTAAFTRTDVAVTDIETDEHWAKYRHLALPHGFIACWSSPILDAWADQSRRSLSTIASVEAQQWESESVEDARFDIVGIVGGNPLHRAFIAEQAHVLVAVVDVRIEIGEASR